MATTNEAITRRQISLKNFQKRVAQFTQIMTPINANRGENLLRQNCGHVAIRLNGYLADLERVILRVSRKRLKIQPVPTGPAGHKFFWSDTSKKRINSLNTNAKDFLVHQNINNTSLDELTSVMKKDDGKTKVLVDLSTEAELKNLPLVAATYQNITEKLKKLPRRASDNTGWGIIIYTNYNKKRFHEANFFVDSDDQVYFLDAQPELLYISDKPDPGYLDDIFYISTVPEKDLKIENKISDTDQDVKIKIEEVETTSNFSAASSSSSSIVSASSSSMKSSSSISSGTITFQHLHQVADQGDVEAQYFLASCYADGKGIEKNGKKAIHYYQLAAKQGDADAQFILGYYYLEGKNVKQDLETAVDYFQQAAKQGEPNAQFFLGIQYLKGEGVTQSFEQAFTYFQLSATQDHDASQHMLGIFYEGGFGTEKDENKALHYYQLSANQGYKTAQSDLKKLQEKIAARIKPASISIQTVSTAASSSSISTSVSIASTSSSYSVAKQAEHIKSLDHSLLVLCEAAKIAEMPATASINTTMTTNVSISTTNSTVINNTVIVVSSEPPNKRQKTKK